MKSMVIGCMVTVALAGTPGAQVDGQVAAPAASVDHVGLDPGDWPAWRGPRGDGVSQETGWRPEGRPLWRADVGLGYSAPSIAGGWLFVLGHDAATGMDVLRALDAETGELRWSDTFAGELRAFDHEGGTLTTPAVGAERLFVTSREGQLRCYERESGRLLWFKDLLAAYGVPPSYYGYASSPVLTDDLVITSAGETFAFERTSGDLVWRAPTREANFSTPTRTRLAGQPALAVFGQQGLDLLDEATGEMLRFFEWHRSDRLVNASSPVVVGEDALFVSSAYDHGGALVDAAADPAQALWASRRMRTKMAGCVLTAGGLFGFDESMLTCLDAADGSVAWRARGLGNGSISAGDGKLLILTSEGELLIAEATTLAFRELVRVPVFDDGGVYWTAPVLSGGRIYCRSNRGGLVARDHRTPVDAVAQTADSEQGAASRDEPLPAAASLFERHLVAVGGAAAFDFESTHQRGTFAMRAVGFRPVSLDLESARPNLWRMRFDLPPPRPGSIERMHDGEAAYEVNAYLGPTLYDAPRAAEWAELLTPWAAVDWIERYPAAKTLERTVFEERDCYRVQLGGDRGSLYFDAESGLLAGRDGLALTVFDDYHAFPGSPARLPTSIRSFQPDTGIEEVLRIESVEFDGVEPARFERPAEIQTWMDDGAH